MAPPRTQTWVNMTAAVAWVVALGGMVALAWGDSIPTWTRNIAALCSLLAIVYAVLIVSQKVTPPPREQLPGMLAIALAPVTWLAAASGGAGSPAIVALALGTRAIAGTEDLRTAISVALGALIAITAIDMSLGATVSLAETLTGAAIFSAIAVLPAWQVKRALESRRQRRRAPRSELIFGDRSPSDRRPDAPLSDLRRGAEVTRQEAEERRQIEVLHRYLRDVRDTIGAEEVIFWRWTTNRDTLVATACSTAIEPDPTKFNHGEWMPLVRWAADERIVHFDDSRSAPRVAIGPVPGPAHDPQSLGAISISAASALSTSHDDLKQWIPRYASHVALLADLLETREEVALQNRRMQALLTAAQTLQSNRTLDSLGRAVCDAALEVTSATRAALVRWHANTNDGEVQSVSSDHRISQGWPISEDSQVGTMCRNGLPQVWEDARLVSRSSRIYGSWETTQPIGSLAIIPLKRDAGVIGAIVIEGDEPGDVLIAEMRNVRLLAAIAAVSLETLWEIEEVTRRARTDQLTGLWNRRYFEEQLTRVLAETDRFGGTTALVVADIDFFKLVNDTYGHEGGDAVLRQVAQIFQEGVRHVDVGARYGGEEIAVLLPQTSLQGALEFAERLRKMVETRAVRFNGREIPITASFGVACYPESVRSHEALFPAADRALYQAKAEGRNRVRCALPMLVSKSS